MAAKRPNTTKTLIAMLEVSSTRPLVVNGDDVTLWLILASHTRSHAPATNDFLPQFRA